MDWWVIIAGISLAFSVPGLFFSYYNLALFISMFRYPKSLEERPSPIGWNSLPLVSILIATFNERFVIARTLDAIKGIDYPKSKLLVVVADDSTDETKDIIDEKIADLNNEGVRAVVSRRNERTGFKSGALRQASRFLDGDYVLLLDADSTLRPGVLTSGLNAITRDPGFGFVSFRVGHYNREQNLITRLFALQLDQGDSVVKMGSYSINAPISFQGGFTLVRMSALRNVGFWVSDSIVEDADLSCRLYCAGYRGIYLSSVRIFSEDPSSLEVWKKQAARVAHGWAKCASANWKMILSSGKLSLWRRIALLSTFLGPFQGLSWIVVTFVSALGLILGLSAPSNSIFTNPGFIILATIPLVTFFVSGAYALYIQKIMTARNVILLPLLSYTGSCMTTAIMIGFLNGMRGKAGFFFRTPKYGQEHSGEERYHRDIQLDKIALAEGILSALALAMSVAVLLQGVWALALTLAGFGVLTLKSMNLKRLTFTSRTRVRLR